MRRYHEPTEQDIREQYIRDRLKEAVQALRRSQFPERFFRRSDPETGEVALPCVWPDIARDRSDVWFAEGWGLLPGTRTRVLPTRAEISAMEEVLPWLYGIHDLRHRLAVVLRAWPGPEKAMGWRRVAANLSTLGERSNRPWLKCSHTTARLWERLGVEEIVGAIPKNRTDDCPRDPSVNSNT